MKSRFFLLLLLYVTLLLSSCKSLFPVKANANLIKIEKSSTADTALIAFYKPYKDSLDKMMQIKIAELETDLFKKQPESTLGNLVADILLAETKQYVKQPVDFGVMNYGGIRVSSLSKGNLMINDAYLISPFDNYLVAQKVSGMQVQAICDSLALKGGWPVSGISFEIKNKKAQHIQIQYQDLDLSKNYTMATIDYVANGGDGMALLKTVPQMATGVLFRDAIIDYWKQQTLQGKKINAQLENRIKNVE